MTFLILMNKQSSDYSQKLNYSFTKLLKLLRTNKKAAVSKNSRLSFKIVSDYKLCVAQKSFNTPSKVGNPISCKS